MIFHIAERSRWEQALAAGEYTVSTRGLELSEVGFIHAATAAQVAGVAERFYRDLSDLVLLSIDESRLSSPLRWDPVGDEMFPHIYGPLNTGAVVAVEPFTP